MKLRIICDNSLLEDQGQVDIEINWLELYPYAVDKIPPDIPDKKGKTVKITTFADSDHEHDLENIWSVTGLLMFPKTSNPLVQQAEEYIGNLNLRIRSGYHENCHRTYHVNTLQSQNGWI